MKDEHGFSLIELITIIAIVGVISIFALAKFSGSEAHFQYESAIDQLATDIRYAQQLAISEGETVRVYVDQSNNKYYLKWDDDSYVKRLVGSGDYVVQFGLGKFEAVSITASELVDGYLSFDSAGVPTSGGTAFTGTLSVATLNSAIRLQIAANTGFLSVENL